jgi:peptidyl-prolyl cis-trans isomerase B (cyclophilin B)
MTMSVKNLHLHRRSWLLALISGVFGLAVQAQTPSSPALPNSPSTSSSTKKSPMSQPQVELHIAGHGIITIELDAEKAPKSAANFLAYVNKGHYNNTIFHRVIDGFMIQGGGFEPGMKQKGTDAPIANEANNGLKNATYTLAMARTGDPHSATAQFFINVADNGFLNHTSPTPSGWGYAVFGKVVKGTEVVDAIRKVPTGRSGFHENVPKTDVVITKAVAL